ncbi:unnamed protein product [Brugia pahangi]|uniref:Neur_chan_LBD domain-containing protein n=1 Tax=Brugia pahangi TaxID=6280 RepID=A0A0N4TU54_BRUPA|nr:unnamed protein product [Brugia pahangi]
MSVKHQVFIFKIFAALQAISNYLPPQLKLVRDMLETYDKKSRPVWDHSRSINVTFSMDLYQILQVDEPQQYVLLNAWIIERWYDEFLYWRPEDYDNITEIHLPHSSIWLPDTTLYNSSAHFIYFNDHIIFNQLRLIMKDDDTRRLLNVKLTADENIRAAYIELLYPTIYKFSCLLNLRFFPFDIQGKSKTNLNSVCSMIFSSWTFDQKGIDYFAYSDIVGTTNYIENEGWHILRTAVKKKEVKYECCPNKYTLLSITLYLRRKPLFYIINLIIPTSITTLIAIVGFFTHVFFFNLKKVFLESLVFRTSTASGMREEKVSLGITTLLSMSILMLMISDQMPTTSTFIPLIGWFILAMITIITFGTLASSVIIAIQKRGRQKSRLTPRIVCLMKFIACIMLEDIPKHLRETHEKELKTTTLLNEEGQHFPRIKQAAILQRRQKTQAIEPHLCELSTLSYNNNNNGTDLLSPKEAGQSVDISDILDPPMSSFCLRYDSLKGGNIGSKIITSEKPQRPSQNVSNTCEASAYSLIKLLILHRYCTSIKFWNSRMNLHDFFKMRSVFDRTVGWHEMNMTGWQKYWNDCFSSCLSSFLHLSLLVSTLWVFTIGAKWIMCCTIVNSVAMLLLFAATFALSVTSLEIHQSVSEVEKGDEMHYFISERQQLPHIRLIRDLLSTKRYDPSVRPVGNYSKSLTVHISMSLYQVVDVDEPSQYLTLNIWMIQKWVDEFLDWNPSEYDMINYTVLPHSALWIPDTFIYNRHSTSFVVMSREGSERYMNVAVKSRHWKDKCGAEVFFLYPALYTIRCRIDIRYFPYDHQNCTLTLGSWTSSKALLNYTTDKAVNMHSYIPNEEWDILSFNLYRHEYLYACCQDPWVIIEGSLIIRRKPLYYVVNLIIPTTILTLGFFNLKIVKASLNVADVSRVQSGKCRMAIVGFFTPASTNDERTEKITIGITALLAISILMLMVSDQMPTTSDFVPLIGDLILGSICQISLSFPQQHFVLALFSVFMAIIKTGNVLQRLKQKKKSIQYTVQSLDKEKLTLTELSVKSPMQGILESETNKQAQQGAQRLSAKENWTQISFRLKDILHKNRDRSEVIPKENSLTSLLQKMRKTSTVHSDRRNLSLWNSAVQFVRFTSNDLSQKPESAELKSMKYHRQCTLEWEFLATVVDRIFLLLFSTITILIIIVLAITAKLAQYRFNTALEIAQN